MSDDTETLTDEAKAAAALAEQEAKAAERKAARAAAEKARREAKKAEAAASKAPEGDEDEKDDAAEPEPEDVPCGECMTAGVPADVTAIGCSHGSWTRDEDGGWTGHGLPPLSADALAQ